MSTGVLGVRNRAVINGNKAQLDDRLQSALHENAQLKQQRTELQTKLRKVETQFRRLAADWQRSQGESEVSVQRVSTSARQEPHRLHKLKEEETEQYDTQMSSKQEPFNRTKSSNQYGNSNLYNHFRPTTVKSTLSQKANAAASAFRSLQSKPKTSPLRTLHRASSLHSQLATDASAPVDFKANTMPAAHKATNNRNTLEYSLPQLNEHVENTVHRSNGWLPHIRETHISSNSDGRNNNRIHYIEQSKNAAVDAQNTEPWERKEHFPSAIKWRKLQEEVMQSKVECATLREQLKNAFLELQEAQHQQLNTQSQSQQLMLSMRSSLNSQQHGQQEMENEYKKIIDSLTRERDALRLHVQKISTSAKAQVCSDSVPTSSLSALAVDSTQLASLEREIHTRTMETSQLRSRLEGAEREMKLLKEQSTHLTKELQRTHEEQITMQQELVAALHVNKLLEIQCTNTKSMEQTISEKNNELLKMEQELVKMANALQTCHRETEHTVRAEYNTRISEEQQRRESIEAERQALERQLLDTQHQCRDAENKVNNLTQSITYYKEQIAQLEREKAQLYMQLSQAEREHMMELNDEDVQRAIALATLHKKQSQSRKRELVSQKSEADAKAANVTASVHIDNKGEQSNIVIPVHVSTSKLPSKEPLQEEEERKKFKENQEEEEEYELLHWDDTYENNQMREALSTAALDIELANTRCEQMHETLSITKKQLETTRRERDELYNENVELRRRLTHVQTVFAKEQLENYYASLENNVQINVNAHREYTDDDNNDNDKNNMVSDANTLQVEKSDRQHSFTGQIDLIVNFIEFSNDDKFVERVLHLEQITEPTALFLSLDGLAAFETMLSPTFVTLQDVSHCEVHFQYTDLEPNNTTTLKEIQDTKFVFQLHHITQSTETISSSDNKTQTNGKRGNNGNNTAHSKTIREKDGSLPCTEIIAMAELAGNVLLTARDGDLCEVISLITGSGEVLGKVHLTISCKHLLLPVNFSYGTRNKVESNNINIDDSAQLLNISQSPVLTSEEIQSALIALRNVSHVRVHVYRVEHLPIPRKNAEELIHELYKEPEMLQLTSSSASALPNASLASRLLQPYLFYTAYNPISPRGVNPITDTTLYPLHTFLTASSENDSLSHVHLDSADQPNSVVNKLKNSLYVLNADFDSVPVDHRVIMDSNTVLFFAHSSLVFAIFDAKSHDACNNLGSAQIALRPLLASPTTSIIQNIKLPNHSTISVSVSWVTAT